MARGYMATGADQLIAFTTASALHSLLLTSVGENIITGCSATRQVKIRSRQRALVEEAIRETCKKKKMGVLGNECKKQSRSHSGWGSLRPRKNPHCVQGKCHPKIAGRWLLAFK